MKQTKQNILKAKVGKLIIPITVSINVRIIIIGN